MRGEQDLKEELIQNLQDAGCNQDIIDQFLVFFDENENEKVFQLLSEQRKKLLNILHKSQKEIDILDYLILDLEKNNYKIVK